MRASLDGALSSALSRSSHRQPSVFFSSLAITRLERRLFPRIFFSTVRSTLFESFLFRPAPAASSSEPESLYLDIQRVTNRQVESSLATNLRSRQAVFVQENYCAS